MFITDMSLQEGKARLGLIKITDLGMQLGLSSRTLRYYEEAGLITSIRPQFEKYRYYDEQNVQRLRQIMVLRKMQIPIKDIVRIYDSREMVDITKVFVDKLSEIDHKVTVLSELKHIINEFLNSMIEKGIRHISALPLLYEEMDKQLAVRESVGMEQLSDISENLVRPPDVSIAELPRMRVLSSCLKDDPQNSDTDAFSHYIQMNGIRTEYHGSFEYRENEHDVMISKIADDFVNDSCFADYFFEGGLFAAANLYLDDDINQLFRSLIKSFDENKFYQIDYAPDGSLRHAAMTENLISPDERRQLVTLYVPVKKRIPDVTLYPKPVEVTDITEGEINGQNPLLWEKEVAFDKITPVNAPHYRVLDSGEAEYTGWISSRTLNTNVFVKLPFKLDIDFRIPMNDEQFGYGDSEGSIIFYHGSNNYNSGENLKIMDFGINMNNHSICREEAISFHQPIFHDLYHFPKRGGIRPNEYNHVTWIVGQKHLAVIINGEIRYCGTDFPYMFLDLNREEAYPVVIGSNGQGMKYFRKIRIGQLACTQTNRMKSGALAVNMKRSNNLIPMIHRLITEEYGEIYRFNGSAAYVMECLGEKEFDYLFFAGLTGDVFAQHYKQPSVNDGINVHYQVNGDGRFFEGIFEKCGYPAVYAFSCDLRKKEEMYLKKLVACIDKGVPVISTGYADQPCGVFVGYEEYGKTLIYISGNNSEPQRVSYDKAMGCGTDKSGRIFVGDKKEEKKTAEIYRKAIYALPELLTTDNDKYCFGASAFRKWADDVENGYFEQIKPEEFDPLSMYVNLVFVLATNGSCCPHFLQRAYELNPDMTYLNDIIDLYKRMAAIWHNDDGTDLEALGGGFNVTLETLQKPRRREKIAARIRECGDVIDEVVRILNEKRA